MSVKKFLVYMSLLSTIVLVGGCAEDITQDVRDSVANTKNSNVDVDLDNKLVQVSNQDGSFSQIGSGATLPEDWPVDVSFPDDIQLTLVTTLNGGNNVVFTSDAPPDVIISYYEAELAASGWSVKDSTTTATLSTLGATNNERTIEITSINNANGQGNTTTLSIQTSN